MDVNHNSKRAEFIPVICIGAGISGICVGAQLQLQLGFTDFHIFERQEEFGGTWASNTYPGCACDVPSILYSFSFAMNPGWTEVFPSHSEIKAYLVSVAEKFGLRERTTFNITCQEARWIPATDPLGGRWRVTFRDDRSGENFVKECKILLSGVGGFSTPNPPEATADFSKFSGPVIHCARWNHDVSLVGKDVVVIGNGCSASQLIPAIAKETKSVTQIVRSGQWIVPMPKVPLSPATTWAFRNVPLAMRAFRILLFLLFEYQWPLFHLDEKGRRRREQLEGICKAYVAKRAPREYHDILIPNFGVGCKRRVFDASYYMKLLNEPNIHLTRSSIQEVLPKSVRTSDGEYSADIIVLATGFRVGTDLQFEVVGRDGRDLNEHFKSQGGFGAYNTTSVSGFPNLFFFLGPNAATGHMSTIVAIENAVDLAITMIKPILRGQVDAVDVKPQAQRNFVLRLQATMKRRVWGSCASWYHAKGWNAATYPWSQYHYWWRTHFPVWNDWQYSLKDGSHAPRPGWTWVSIMSAVVAIPAALILAVSMWLRA